MGNKNKKLKKKRIKILETSGLNTLSKVSMLQKVQKIRIQTL
jgi:hypothetical protein